MLLSPYRVLDLTTALGAVAGKVFADLGADVIKVEPPGGDASRASRDGLDWVAANAGKRSVILDLTKEHERFLDLVRGADFLIESFRPGTLSYQALARENPKLIMVSITPFGQSGPYAQFEASDLEIMALSGAMALAGEPGGEPMRVTAPQAHDWAGVEAVMGALTALACRRRTGYGQHVDVSAQAAVLAAIAHAPAFWDLNGISPERAGVFITGRSVTGAKMRALWPCKDGWLNFIIYGGEAGRHTNRQLVEWMAECDCAPEWMRSIDWTNFAVTNLTQEEVDRLEAPIGRFLLSLTRHEFLDGALAREMLGYPVSTVEDIAHDRQLAARDFWCEVVDSVSGRRLTSPGGFAVVNGKRLAAGRRAARPGEHNQEILAGGRR